MWSILDAATGCTNEVVVPADGIVSVTKPDSVQVFAYVNDVTSAVHHVHVKAGDKVKFVVKNTAVTETPIALEYAGSISNITVPAMVIKSGDKAKKKGKKMTPAEYNLFATPQSNVGGAIGGGLGAGLLGGLLGTMLFRNGGIGAAAIDGAVPATLSGVESVVNNSAITTALGDIKASIPFNEAQVQLALAGAQADINGNIVTQSNAIVAGQNRDALANALAFGNVNTNLGNALSNITNTVNVTAASNLAATKDASLLAERNAWALTQAISNDGEKTRALIQSIDKTNDSRLITSQANEIVELRHDRRLQEATGNITISNTNTATAQQAQAQAQQQLQVQYQVLAQLAALNADVQSVKQNSVVFNSGTQTNSGNQGAANTRVA